jgi:hypothetical protein
MGTLHLPLVEESNLRHAFYNKGRQIDPRAARENRKEPTPARVYLTSPKSWGYFCNSRCLQWRRVRSEIGGWGAVRPANASKRSKSSAGMRHRRSSK